MEHHYNESDRFSNVRTSVIVRKSPDESRNRFGRSQQWNPTQQYAGGGSHSQQHTHGNLLSPPIDNYTQRFPIILNNQRSSYYQQTSHYTRRNEDRLTFHSYQNYNTIYPSSNQPIAGFNITNQGSVSSQHSQSHGSNWNYQEHESSYRNCRPYERTIPQEPSNPPQTYPEYTEARRPITPPYDLPSDICLAEYEERLPQPSALLKKFTSTSSHNSSLSKNSNNQNDSSPNCIKKEEDANMKIDIDEIFSKISHLTNFTPPSLNSVPSQNSPMDSSADMSDDSFNRGAADEFDAPHSSKPQASKFKSPTHVIGTELSPCQREEDLSLSSETLIKEKEDCSPTPTFKEQTLNNDPMDLYTNANELNNETGKDEKRPVSDCHVCGDRAIAHMHYGGICCYSCKAFFRRAVQNGKDKTYKCKRESDCEVSVNTRRGCQKCRFEKCREIGMTASWVLSDEQCEIRFGKGKSKRKAMKSACAADEEEVQQVLETSVHLSNIYPFTKEDELIVVHMMCVYEASKEMIHFSDENIFLSDKILGKSEKHNYSASEMNSMVATVIKKNIFMMSDNPFFKGLTFGDRKKLLSKNMTEMCHIRGALRFNAANKSFQWYLTSKEKTTNGMCSPKKDIGQGAIETLYNSKEAARDIITIMERIASLHLPTEVILLLMHVVVFSGDGLNLDKPDFVQDAQAHYLSMVYRYLLNKLPAADIHKNFSRVLAVLVELRESGDKANKQKIRGSSSHPESEYSSSTD